MAEKVDSDEEKFKRQRALLVDYLEHASNVIAKKVTEVDIPERSHKIKEEDKKTAPKSADVSVSPFATDESAEADKVVIEVPIQAPPIVINPSEVDKLLYLREKRDLLERALLSDDKDKKDIEGKDNQAVPEIKIVEPIVEKIIKPLEIESLPAVPKKKEIAKPIEPKPIIEAVKKIASQATTNKPEVKILNTEKFSLAVFLENFKTAKLDGNFQGWQVKIKKYLHRKKIRRVGRGVRRFAYGSLTFALGFYLAYLLLVYSFAPRSSLFQEISGQVPAPALISNYGLVDFHSYQQVKSSAINFGSAEDPALLVLKWQIINSLASQYGVDQDLDQDLLVEVLKRKVVGDSSMNYYGSRKFLELKQAQRRGDNLEQMAEQTGLTIHRGVYAKQFAAQKFGDLVYGLQLNATSPVIVNDQGIYVLQTLASSATKIEFNYLFVPARTLGQLVDEKLADAWVVSLID